MVTIGRSHFNFPTITFQHSCTFSITWELAPSSQTLSSFSNLVFALESRHKTVWVREGKKYLIPNNEEERNGDLKATQASLLKYCNMIHSLKLREGGGNIPDLALRYTSGFGLTFFSPCPTWPPRTLPPAWPAVE